VLSQPLRELLFARHVDVGVGVRRGGGVRVSTRHNTAYRAFVFVGAKSRTGSAGAVTGYGVTGTATLTGAVTTCSRSRRLRRRNGFSTKRYDALATTSVITTPSAAAG
jgi:hypothetical protein